MFNVCTKCGMYRADKLTEGDVAICPACRHRQPFVRLPLALITGASGTGKSAVCRELLTRNTDWILLDADLLWRPELEGEFFDLWLRLAKSINQSGRPVALFGGGTGVPENIETKIERRYFAQTHYLALVCTEEEQIVRLRARPAWRGTEDEGFLERQIDFNRWFQTEGPNQYPEIQLLDTTDVSIDDATSELEAWLLQIKW